MIYREKKDMKNGEIREYKGKKYIFEEQDIFENEMDWHVNCCKDCCFKGCEAEAEFYKHLGECYEIYREDKKNGIFKELK